MPLLQNSSTLLLAILKTHFFLSGQARASPRRMEKGGGIQGKSGILLQKEQVYQN
jgi:hypothetical protein